MTVKRTQNSGTPEPVQQRMADITDGTSNTLKSGGNAEKPFSKDAFETSKPAANSLCTNEQIPALVKSDDDSKLKLEASKGQVVESLNVKYTMFLGD